MVSKMTDALTGDDKTELDSLEAVAAITKLLHKLKIDVVARALWADVPVRDPFTGYKRGKRFHYSFIYRDPAAGIVENVSAAGNADEKQTLETAYTNEAFNDENERFAHYVRVVRQYVEHETVEMFCIGKTKCTGGDNLHKGMQNRMGATYGKQGYTHIKGIFLVKATQPDAETRTLGIESKLHKLFAVKEKWSNPGNNPGRKITNLPAYFMVYIAFRRVENEEEEEDDA